MPPDLNPRSLKKPDQNKKNYSRCLPGNTKGFTRNRLQQAQSFEANKCKQYNNAY